MPDENSPLTQDALDALLAAAGAGDTAASDEWSNDFGTEDAQVDDGASDESVSSFGAGAGMGGFSMGGASSAYTQMPGAAPIDLPSFGAPTSKVLYHGNDDGSGMGRIRDIPLEVTVVLGRTRLLIRDILDLGTGSIIELDKIAGEPVDLLANGLLVARGEVIVIDDNFGVRVTEIITEEERRLAKEQESIAA